MIESWRSTQGQMTYGDKLHPGSLIAIDAQGFRHKPWVLYDVLPRDDGRTAIIVRPVGAETDFAEHNQTLTMAKHAFVRVLPDHYALCAACGELPPCAEVWTETISDAAAERAARFEVEGVCPSCQKPITRRQHSHRFEENLYVPLGPPVVFHTRRGCVMGAIDYDRNVAKATGREPRMSCEGLHVHHLDNAHECTNITCPGTQWRHRSYARCYALNERCNRPECWAIEESTARIKRNETGRNAS